jgi:hypothetical protein
VTSTHTAARCASTGRAVRSGCFLSADPC